MIKFKCGCVYESAKDKKLLMRLDCKSNHCVVEDNADIFIEGFAGCRFVSWLNKRLECVRIDKETGVRILID